MKIAFIGGGYSSCISSILLKRKYPNYDIYIFEYNNILLKKLSATGNGRCNINNISDDINNFNNDNVKYLLNKYPLNIQIKTLNNLNIYLTELNNGCLYPISLSSDNVCKLLIQQIKSLNINVTYNCFIKDYYVDNNKIIIIDQNNNKYSFDKVVFSNGSIASPKLGCDKSLLDIFKSHNYDVNPFISGLCPIKVKENVKSLFGVRFKCDVSVYNNDKLEFKEYGEVIFKRDGLSGIVIFNSTVKTFQNLNNKYKICLDIVKNDLDIDKLYEAYINHIDPLYSLIPSKLIDYIYKRLNIDINNINKDKIKLIIDTLHNLTFTFDKRYQFEESQICLGGIDINNVDINTMESKIENNIYFIGEILNIKGVSGGFNLKFALLTSLALILNI